MDDTGLMELPIPRHPVILSENDWDVQLPSKRIVFRFHETILRRWLDLGDARFQPSTVIFGDFLSNCAWFGAWCHTRIPSDNPQHPLTHIDITQT